MVEILLEHGLKIQPEKYKKKDVANLGHVISKDGVKPDPKKITAIQQFPTPINQKKVKRFLGLARYYRKFIPRFSKTSKPLTYLLKKDVPFARKDFQQNTHLTRLRPI